MRFYLLLATVMLGSCANGGDPVMTGPVDLAVLPRPDLLPETCAPTCTAAAPYCNASKHCVACLSDDNCPLGSICKVLGAASAVCVKGCLMDNRCQPDGSKGSMACCGGACVDTASNRSNCGGCGMACAIPNATASCSAGKCLVAQCNPGYTDCNADLTDGCEASVHTDPQNCTTCGKICKYSHGGGGCADGCYLATCDIGYDDCDSNEANGCEVAVDSDARNCGACGVSCGNPAHASGTCTVGQCTLTCIAGWGDCNNSFNDGCELPTSADPNNCGACGNVCANGLICKVGQCTCPNCNIPNASSKCINNVCVLDKCNAGYSDCDNNPNNGCESPTSADANNCGGCGNVCPNNMPICVNSVCTNSTHNLMALAPDYNAAAGCGDSSSWWSQNFGQMNYQACEALANKYGAMYMGQTGYFQGGNYAQCPYQNFTRWEGEADANNAWVGTNGWNQVNSTAKTNINYCVLAYANANAPGNGTFNSSAVSLNGQTYLYNDYGVIAENTCYTNARLAGARPLNPWMLQGINPARAHMAENHTCHGSIEYNGVAQYAADGAGNHNYRCIVGYNR